MDISASRKKNLRRLAHAMNRQNQSSVPVTSALLDCFDVVLEDKEVDFLLKLAPGNFYSKEKLSALSEQSPEKFDDFFDSLLKKGVIWPSQQGGQPDDYQLAPILLGWFEIFLSDGGETPVQKEFARRVNHYLESLGKLNIFPIRGALNAYSRWSGQSHRRVVSPLEERDQGRRRIVIEKPISPAKSKIFLTDTVLELVDRFGTDNQIAVVHCFCRQMRKMLDDPCRFQLPHEACIVLGRLAQHAVEHQVGRFISKDEALETIEETETRGAVHQVFHQREDLELPEVAICNCCWDCCGILGSYNRGLMPLTIRASYLAEVNSTECEGCAKCQHYCPVEAISITNGYSEVDAKLCIGCGQCALKCPEGAVSLKYQERDIFLPLRSKSELRLGI